jgi:hypothetical protein
MKKTMEEKIRRIESGKKVERRTPPPVFLSIERAI